MLDKNSHMPIYIQLSDILLKGIETGEIKPGETLPSENELSAKYEISRMTAKKAVDNLMYMGKVERIRGKGTFVKAIEKKIELPLNELRSFTQKVRELGKEPINKIIKFKIIEADMKVSKYLNIPLKEEVFYMERVRIIDDTPAVFEQSYIPKNILPNLNLEILLKSKFEYVTSLGYKIGSSEREIEAMIPSEYVAKILNIKRTEPILFAKSLTRLENGQILEYSLISYNQKKYRFKFTATN